MPNCPSTGDTQAATFQVSFPRNVYYTTNGTFLHDDPRTDGFLQSGSLSQHPRSIFAGEPFATPSSFRHQGEDGVCRDRKQRSPALSTEWLDPSPIHHRSAGALSAPSTPANDLGSGCATVSKQPSQAAVPTCTSALHIRAATPVETSRVDHLASIDK